MMGETTCNLLDHSLAQGLIAAQLLSTSETNGISSDYCWERNLSMVTARVRKRLPTGVTRGTNYHDSTKLDTALSALDLLMLTTTNWETLLRV
jgi:hypothetical protein